MSGKERLFGVFADQCVFHNSLECVLVLKTI